MFLEPLRTARTVLTKTRCKISRSWKHSKLYVFTTICTDLHNIALLCTAWHYLAFDIGIGWRRLALLRVALPLLCKFGRFLFAFNIIMIRAVALHCFALLCVALHYHFALVATAGSPKLPAK
eukprot:8296909-Pyramimonas_sp.AAC.1